MFEIAELSDTSELIFQVMMAVALLVWAVWLLLPKTGIAARLAREPAVFVTFGVVYAGLVLSALVVGLPDGAGFTTVDGVMRLFDSEWGTLAGWAHYLAFDLFAGAYIMRDSGGTYRAALPLLLTLAVGPIGLLVYLVGRRHFRDERANGL